MLTGHGAFHNSKRGRFWWRGAGLDCANVRSLVNSPKMGTDITSCMKLGYCAYANLDGDSLLI